jgi:RimJ/RimL family protein N-acetyltransferase
METFIESIDTYLSNYSTYNNGKVVFDCSYGELIFFKNNSNILTIFGIYLHPEYRQKGLCRELLHYLIDKSPDNFKVLCVESVLSKILYEYLLRFEYKNKKFKITKSGFLYKL